MSDDLSDETDAIVTFLRYMHVQEARASVALDRDQTHVVESHVVETGDDRGL